MGRKAREEGKGSDGFAEEDDESAEAEEELVEGEVDDGGFPRRIAAGRASRAKWRLADGYGSVLLALTAVLIAYRPDAKQIDVSPP